MKKRLILRLTLITALAIVATVNGYLSARIGVPLWFAIAWISLPWCVFVVPMIIEQYKTQEE